jgi:enolase-phosphatase E1
MGIQKIKRPQAIVMDVEETTTSWDYFRTTLRPYIVSHTERYLKSNYYRPVVQDIIAKIRKLPSNGIPADKGNDMDVVIEAVDNVVQTQLYSTGNKSRAVYSLCHLVWTFGFESGDLKGHVFNDVPAALRNWKRNSVKIFMISVMSLEMQELTFTRSQYGNLDQFVSGYFTTEDYGQTNTKECFEKICKKIKVSSTDVVYVTKRWKDADAAMKAGIKPILIDRTTKVQDRDKIKSLKEVTWP